MIFTSPPGVTLVGCMVLALKSNRFSTLPVPSAACACSAFNGPGSPVWKMNSSFFGILSNVDGCTVKFVKAPVVENQQESTAIRAEPLDRMRDPGRKEPQVPFTHVAHEALAFFI